MKSENDLREIHRDYVSGTATLLLGDRGAGDYLVRHMSAGGALLADQPVLAEGTQLCALLRISGVCDPRLSGAMPHTQTEALGWGCGCGPIRSGAARGAGSTPTGGAHAAVTGQRITFTGGLLQHPVSRGNPA